MARNLRMASRKPPSPGRDTDPSRATGWLISRLALAHSRRAQQRSDGAPERDGGSPGRDHGTSLPMGLVIVLARRLAGPGSAGPLASARDSIYSSGGQK